MHSIIYLEILFIAKVIDNAINTTKTIMIQRSRWVLAGIAVILSDFIYFWIMRNVVTSDHILTMLIVAVAGGVGCSLACFMNDKLSKDRTYVNVIMSDNLEAMKNLRDFLAEYHITNVTADSYTLDWNTKTITITAYPETKAEAIEQARRIDLLTYLSCCEPGNLIHISGNNYCTREHDSLKISNGKWYWFSRGIGGVSDLDYLMKVKEYSLPEAVELIVGRDAIEELPTKEYEFKTKPVKKLLMPELTDKPYRAKQYLRERGIHPEIIQYCIDNSLLFETAKYHNVVFVGYDKQGIAKYAAMRGTKSAYKGEVTGSDKRFSFSISETTNAEHAHLFESAIDLLSFATLELQEGRNWKQVVLCQEKVQIKCNQFSLCLAKLNLLFLSHYLLDFSDILPHIGLGINTRNGCEYVLYGKMFLCIQKSTYMHVYN